MIKFVITLALASCILSGYTDKPDLRYKKTADSTMNIKAPDFLLKDINGKTVALDDYKGKVLVLDFWATWCAPCRESFPSVKMVMDKYVNDPGVAFLFIDTREKVENYPVLVKQFLTKNKYPFHVIFDEKGSDGKMDVTYKKYVMPGIPSKYFIDSNGIIRFNTLGYKPGQSPQEAANEITELIEKTKMLH